MRSEKETAGVGERKKSAQATVVQTLGKGLDAALAKQSAPEAPPEHAGKAADAQLENVLQEARKVFDSTAEPIWNDTADPGEISLLTQDLILLNAGGLESREAGAVESDSPFPEGKRWMLGTSFFLPPHRPAVSMADFVAVAVSLIQGRAWSGAGRQAGQSLDGSFSAVSMPNFAFKASFVSSRRDLRNTHLHTDLRSQMVN